MKKSIEPTHKPKKHPISYYAKKLWGLCKEITRKRYQRKDGYWNCYTCGRLLDEPVKAQTAHLIPSGSCGAFLRYDLRNLRVCCYHCNINLGGNGAEYYRRMVKEVGQKKTDQLFQDKNKIIKADILWYLEKISHYENELKTIF